MCGLFIGCAENGVAAVVDGFISIVAALCAVRLVPQVKDFLFLSHASHEIGYQVAARELGLQPLLMLDMRLGEGSGCPLLFQLMDNAIAILTQMGTFIQGNIDDSKLVDIREN